MAVRVIVEFNDEDDARRFGMFVDERQEVIVEYDIWDDPIARWVPARVVDET